MFNPCMVVFTIGASQFLKAIIILFFCNLLHMIRYSLAFNKITDIPIPWYLIKLNNQEVWAFVTLIPVAGQCLRTVRIGPHHCGHMTVAVLSSDKHWHTVLEHWLALLGSYDSSTAVSTVTGSSVVRVTVLGHCLAQPCDPVTSSVKDLYQMWKIRSSAPSTACKCSHPLS